MKNIEEIKNIIESYRTTFRQPFSRAYFSVDFGSDNPPNIYIETKLKSVEKVGLRVQKIKELFNAQDVIYVKNIETENKLNDKNGFFSITFKKELSALSKKEKLE